MTWHQELRAALAEWQAAQDAFNAAEPAFVDYQILRLDAAEEKLRVILRQAQQAPARAAAPPAPSAPDAGTRSM
jgi:hypothetical protein